MQRRVEIEGQLSTFLSRSPRSFSLPITLKWRPKYSPSSCTHVDLFRSSLDRRVPQIHPRLSRSEDQDAFVLELILGLVRGGVDDLFVWVGGDVLEKRSEG